ncbi:MAG: phenylalanine--tRNA ligase subunit beta [Anaerolineales bacterium]|nr:phenylalanine--tRNA ligase subunit beta [Anaerolineales bacterium]
MKVPLSWLKDYVEINTPVEELIHRLTLAGLEVEEVHYVGYPLPEHSETKVGGLAWDPEKIVVAEVLEVLPHPDADRLVLCRINDGQTEETAVTGAPNLYDYKGKGPLEQPLKVAYAKEGSVLYDGHQPGWVTATLKATKIRGVRSTSMVCSEKELGISEEHEGIMILDPDTPFGPLVNAIGDIVFDIAITPNIARNANILGVAREIAALTGETFKQPDYKVPWEGGSIEGRVGLEIRNPELNPRFVLGLIEGVTIKPSPIWLQLRLRMAGMRPINNIVDATNYAMLEIGEPLHAFDYDILKQRAKGGMPTIITRQAKPGEKITTLDDVERNLEEFMVLVTDTAGALSIAGVMGGAESEVTENTRNILLEGANWDLINIRRSTSTLKLDSEASYRFARGVHPSMSELGVRRCLILMHQLAGGVIAEGLMDKYPLPPEPSTVTITPTDVQRNLGIDLSPEEISEILCKLEFKVESSGSSLSVTPPDFRLDIGEGIIGKADLMEEIARIYGYDRIPETMIADTIPPQVGNPAFEKEETIRDTLVRLGLQEIVTYRLTAPEREQRIELNTETNASNPYIEIANPISTDRSVMRRSLLASMLEIVEKNARTRDRLALFEISPVFLPQPGQDLPEEKQKLVIALSGKRSQPHWQAGDPESMNFYDLKGILADLFSSLQRGEVKYSPAQAEPFHPGKCAEIRIQEQIAGVFGELHPQIAKRYDFIAPVVAANLDLELLLSFSDRFDVEPVPAYPPVLEDLAVVVDETVLAEDVEAVIRKADKTVIADVRLFDMYRGDQIGSGKKSLAYSVVYQAPDRTLTDQDVGKIRRKVIHLLERELHAELRS